MKKSFLILATMATVMMTACTTDGADECLTVEVTPPADPQQVTLAFTIFEQEPMTRGATTRTATGVADYCTRLDVWIVSEGETVSEAHQASGDAGFGTVQATLDRRRTYTLYAVGHKCTGAATLTDGVVVFPDEKLTHSMVYTTTFTPGETATINCQMQRVVGQIRLVTTDAVPEDCKRLEFRFLCNDRWNMETAAAEHPTDKTVAINLGTLESDGTAIVNLFVMPANLTDTDHITITVTPQDAQGEAVRSPRELTDVPVKAGCRTVCRGALFAIQSSAISFTAEDWQTFDTVEF